MPWEVHSHQRLREKPTSFDIRYSIFHVLGSPLLIKTVPPSERIDDEFLLASSSRVLYAEEQWPPFYRYDYDLESLWWILLWACLFCVSSDIDTEDSACNLGLRIFTYTSQPSMDRTRVMQTLHNAQIQRSVPPKLNALVYFVHALHAFLYRSYATTPNDVDGYLEGIHQSFWRYLNMMQNHVSKMGDIDFSSLE